MSAATTAQPSATPVPAGQTGGTRAVRTASTDSVSRSPLGVDIDAVIQMATARAQTGTASVRSPNGRDTRTQLFVGNLPYRVRWQDLKDLFRKAGTVLRADVSLGSDNRSRGYGTVMLATAEDAGRAIDMFNGYSWQTRTLEVRPDRLPPEPEGPALALPSPLHAMPYVPPTLSHPSWLTLDSTVSTRPQSAGMFSLEQPEGLPIGLRRGSTTSITTASVSLKDIGEGMYAERRGSASPGAGVTLSVQSSSPFVYPSKELPGVAVNGTSPPVNGVMGHGNAGGGAMGRSLFVGNLPFHVQWQDLKDHFRPAGQILRADVATGPDGRSRGFGTVLFLHESDALKGVDMFNGKEYHGRPLKVHFDKYSQSGTNNHPNPSNSPQTFPSNSYHSAQRQQQQQHQHHQQQQQQSLPPSYSNGSVASNSTSYSHYSTDTSLPPSLSQISMSSAAASDYSWPPQPLHHPDYFSSPLSSSGGGTPNKAPLSPGSPMGMPRHHGHGHHPGPISLPPTVFNPMAGGPMSPLMTHGLPPMTPSMPGFAFHPQVQTPPLHPHFLSPGIGPFSPPLNGSPFFSHSTTWNPAPGAPLHHPQSPGSPPPIRGFNPNYPPFGMAYHEQSYEEYNGEEHFAGEGDMGYAEDPAYFPPASEYSSRRESTSAESQKSSDPGLGTDGTTDESAAPSTASFVSVSSKGAAETEKERSPAQPVGLGLVDMMDKLTLAEPYRAAPVPLDATLPAAAATTAAPPPEVANPQSSPIKRAQSTTPSTQMQTPTPPSSMFLSAAESRGPAAEEEDPVAGWTRFSLDGLVPPSSKADRRASWAVGSRGGGGHL